MTPEEPPRLLPGVRRRLRAAPGVLPRVRHAARRRTGVSSASSPDVAAPPLVVSRRLDLARAALPRPRPSSPRRRRRRKLAREERETPIGRDEPHVTVGPGAPRQTVPVMTAAEHPADRSAADDHDRAASARAGRALDQRPTTPTPEPERPRRLAGRQERLYGRARVAARSRAAAPTPSPGPAQAKRHGLEARRRPALVAVFEPPPRLLRRLLGDLRDPGRGERRPLGRPRQGLSRRLSGPRHPLTAKV